MHHYFTHKVLLSLGAKRCTIFRSVFSHLATVFSLALAHLQVILPVEFETSAAIHFGFLLQYGSRRLFALIYENHSNTILSIWDPFEFQFLTSFLNSSSLLIIRATSVFEILYCSGTFRIPYPLLLPNLTIMSNSRLEAILALSGNTLTSCYSSL